MNKSNRIRFSNEELQNVSWGLTLLHNMVKGHPSSELVEKIRYSKLKVDKYLSKESAAV